MNNKSKFLKGNIVFDDKELIIKHDSKTYGLNVLLSVLLLISSTLNAINFLNSGKPLLFYAFLFMAIVCVIFFGLSLFLYFKSIKQKGNWIKITDIQSILYAKAESKVNVEIVQKDIIQKTVSVVNDSDFWQFVDTMKKSGIEVIKK